MAQKGIRLFYWSSKLFEKKEHENYGDLLSDFIVKKVSRRPTIYYNASKSKKTLFKKRYLMAIGSIIAYASKKAHVWGSGIISLKDDFESATFHAVRGPKTRERILEKGYVCPEIYGDPALLMPRFYNPEVKKEFELGIIPHYVDYEQVLEWYKHNKQVKVINLLTKDIEQRTQEILACKKTISSSLHGVIVSHAYAIPSAWVRFSNKLSGDNIKFEDYFLSVGIKPYQGVFIYEPKDVSSLISEVQEHIKRPSDSAIKKCQEDLLKSFPFK